MTASTNRTTQPPRCPDFAEVIRNSTPDASLFAQIAECFSQRLQDFATYYCKDASLGKDAFQEAMLVALSKLDTFRGDSPIEPWLRRIVVSSCARLRRGKKNDPALHASFDAMRGDTVFSDDAPSQEWSLMMAQSFERVWQAMEALDEPNRTLLESHDMHEVSISELASRFGMTEEAVKSRLKRSRAQVRQALMRDVA